MVYFKKVELPQCSYDQIENGLRKVSLKRTWSLDIVLPVSDIGSDKYFLGREQSNSITFTRIRTSFERFLPRAIIRLTPENNYYEIRLTLLSSIIFLFIVATVALALIAGLVNNGNIKGIMTTVIVMVAYVSFIMLELKLVKLKVNKAIEQYVKSKS